MGSISGRVLIAGTASLLLCLFLSPKFIDFLRRREFGQNIREEGPAGHKIKAGTPTMGGIIIMIAFAVPYLILSTRDWPSIGVFGGAVACALLGFADDWTKIVKRRSLGLRARTKLVVTIAISLGLWYIATQKAGVSESISVRFVDVSVDLGPLYPVLIYLVVAGTTSAVNLTDGLDGLAAGCSAIVLLAYIGITFITTGESDLTLLAACMVGACIGFLWFNSFPASIFMGDTGSLGIGGAIAGLAVMTNTEVLLILLGGIFVIEALSVLIQVFSFQLFRKRVFLMAPIHHHFELQAWSETKIILRFWIVAAACAAIAFTVYRLSIRGRVSHGPRFRRGRISSSGWPVRAWPPRSRSAPAGEVVIGCDAGGSDVPALAQAAGRLREAGVEVRLDASGVDFAARARTLIKSPGVPQDAPAIREARARGAVVLGELELAWRLLPNEFVAVTGTNGKTTTTEWIGHVHREAGLPVAVAGNVGTAATSLVDRLAPDVTVVCEASSFQLEDTVAFSPEIAVLLNLSPDHLDRHPSYDDYVAAKLRIFANQGNYDVAVAPSDLGVEDLGGCARRVLFGEGPGPELSDRAGYLWWDEQPIVRVEEIALPGAHNRQNAMATAATCLARGIDSEAVATGLRTFAGVRHRLEQIAVKDGVAWVNDSKATNVASTIVALRAFAGGIHLIAGGRGKQQDFSPLAPLVAERCRAVYLIGEAAADLADALSLTGVPLHQAGDLEHAVALAGAEAVAGEVVLLSPACASYDQYADFEARGDHFRALVERR